ncbi:glycosyltransferase family 2 protein [Azospirillum sp.]|uniref:glycosyltransferase family 2 protein n=1 Tax=Azospirillum sp. TaxID=34012 RepID=UPI002D2FDC13|nr:glycosyltransferase [Azospirillum sp.]HYD64513.1 glycosyltransferase [Azospirillum sp.]
MTKRLTVIIPTCNRLQRITRCLEALERQDTPPGTFDVIVVDDGSTDGTAEALKNRSSTLDVRVLSQANQGPAAARNRALAAGTAPLVLIINDDTILTEGAVRRHIDLHDAAGPGEKKIVLGNFRIMPEYRSDLFTAAVDATTHIFPFSWLKARRILDFSYFITCNTSLARAAFDEAGVFDESFPKPAGEDIEMGYRLYAKGWSIEFVPDLMSWHDSYFTPRSYARARFIRGEEDLRFIHKHPEQRGVYQRHALAFARSHYDRLVNHWDDYQAYVDSTVALTDALIARHQAAQTPAERHGTLHDIMGRIEAIGYLAYAAGAGKSPYFAEVVRGFQPQAVF